MNTFHWIVFPSFSLWFSSREVAEWRSVRGNMIYSYRQFRSRSNLREVRVYNNDMSMQLLNRDFLKHHNNEICYCSKTSKTILFIFPSDSPVDDSWTTHSNIVPIPELTLSLQLSFRLSNVPYVFQRPGNQEFLWLHCTGCWLFFQIMEKTVLRKRPKKSGYPLDRKPFAVSLPPIPGIPYTYTRSTCEFTITYVHAPIALNSICFCLTNKEGDREREKKKSRAYIMPCFRSFAHSNSLRSQLGRQNNLFFSQSSPITHGSQSAGPTLRNFVHLRKWRQSWPSRCLRPWPLAMTSTLELARTSLPWRTSIGTGYVNFRHEKLTLPSEIRWNS